LNHWFCSGDPTHVILKNSDFYLLFTGPAG
jgi:hypothetical protein